MVPVCNDINNTTHNGQMTQNYGTKIYHDARMLWYEQHNYQEPNYLDLWNKIIP